MRAGGKVLYCLFKMRQRQWESFFFMGKRAADFSFDIEKRNGCDYNKIITKRVKRTRKL